MPENLIVGPHNQAEARATILADAEELDVALRVEGTLQDADAIEHLNKTGDILLVEPKR